MKNISPLKNVMLCILFLFVLRANAQSPKTSHYVLAYITDPRLLPGNSAFEVENDTMNQVLENYVASLLPFFSEKIISAAPSDMQHLRNLYEVTCVMCEIDEGQFPMLEDTLKKFPGIMYANVYKRPVPELYLRVKVTDPQFVPDTAKGFLTGNDTLNAVLLHNLVTKYILSYPGAEFPFLKDLYTINCDCDVQALKDTLEKFPAFTTIEIGSYPEVGLSDQGYDELYLKTYPNPATDILHIDLCELPLKCNAISLFNTAGALVRNIKIGMEDCRLSVNMNDETSGVYFLRFGMSNGSFIYKRIVTE